MKQMRGDFVERGDRDASTTHMKINKKLLTRLKKNTRVDNTNENKQEVVDTSQTRI